MEWCWHLKISGKSERNVRLHCLASVLLNCTVAKLAFRIISRLLESGLYRLNIYDRLMSYEGSAAGSIAWLECLLGTNDAI